MTEVRVCLKGERTRQHIIEKAATLFNQRGFAGCSMQDVMEATGLEKGGVYRHFSSKEDLAVEAFRHALSTATKARAITPDPQSDAVDRLMQLIARFIEVPSPLPGGCPLLNTAIDADDGNPALREAARKGLAQWKLRLMKIVEQGIASGEILPATEPRRIANAIVATLEGASMISRLEGKRTAMFDVQETLGLMLGGLRVHH